MTRALTKFVVKRRGFTLRVVPEGSDSYGLHLAEIGNAGQASSGLQLRVKAARARRVIESALTAVKASGHSRSALAVHRMRPVHISEEAGVRLALVLLTTVPLMKSRRVDAMADAVQAMTAEEAYYWYAKCVGENGRRAQRALRLLLAEE